MQILHSGKSYYRFWVSAARFQALKMARELLKKKRMKTGKRLEDRGRPSKNNC
jgi:hypothetical protein